MTCKIYSKINDQILLASVISISATSELRTDASAAEEILQVSLLKLQQGKTIAPHLHRPQLRTTQGTGEAWVVIAGTLTAQIFDTDNSLISSIDLASGDCMVLYRGGHNFTVVSQDAVIYEIKNGPYNGSAADSEKIT